MLKYARPIDDVFFEVLAQDPDVCQEMLRIILNNDHIIVKSVIVQASVKNLSGRSVRLDALCELDSDVICNIEVQRSDNDNHLKRARYHGACITVNSAETGKNFEHIPNVSIVYISEFDIFKQNQVIYHIDKIIRETNTIVDDGLQEIFVNTAVNDGTILAELMQCFTQSSVNNHKFPKLSERVQIIKDTEGGLNIMCEVMERYAKEMVEAGRQEGRIEGMVIGYYNIDLSIDTISEKVGIPRSEVEKIISENC